MVFPVLKRLRARSRRYGLCGCRHALRVPARDAPFLCASFSWTAQELDRRCLDAPCRRGRREKRWSGQVVQHLELSCDRSCCMAANAEERSVAAPSLPRSMPIEKLVTASQVLARAPNVLSRNDEYAVVYEAIRTAVARVRNGSTGKIVKTRSQS
jgi:hypothetical protein